MNVYCTHLLIFFSTVDSVIESMRDVLKEFAPKQTTANSWHTRRHAEDTNWDEVRDELWFSSLDALAPSVSICCQCQKNACIE